MTLGVEVDYVESELDLFQTLINKVRLYDPDILVGYELHNASWGYLIERAAVLGNTAFGSQCSILLTLCVKG